MAKQQKIVFFAPGGTAHTFTVWTDLLEEQIRSIEGIVTLISFAKGAYSITIDPRYDLNEIKDELETMAITDAHLVQEETAKC